MKRSLLLSCACALLLSSMGSIYALTPTQRGPVTSIINRINSGALKGDAIIDAVNALNVTEALMKDTIFTTLNKTVYEALKKQGYPVRSNMMIVQDIKDGTVTGTKIVESRSTLLKGVQIADFLEGYLDPRPSVTAQATVSTPAQKKEAKARITELLSDSTIYIDPQGVTYKELEKTKVALETNANNNTPVTIPSVTVPLTPEQIKERATTGPLAEDVTYTEADLKASLATAQKLEEETKKLEAKPDSPQKQEEAQKLAQKIDEVKADIAEAEAKVQNEPAKLTIVQRAKNAVSTAGNTLYKIGQFLYKPYPPTRVPKIADINQIEKNIAPAIAEVRLMGYKDIASKVEKDIEKVKALAAQAREQKPEEVKQLAQKIEETTAKIDEAKKEAIAKNDTQKAGTLEKIYNGVRLLIPLPHSIPDATPQPTLPTEQTFSTTKESEITVFPVTKEEQLTIPAGVGVTQETITLNKDLQYLLDLINECKKDQNFFVGKNDQKSKTDPSITSSEIHAKFSSFMDKWRGYGMSNKLKDHWDYVLHEYLKLNLTALDNILKQWAASNKNKTIEAFNSRLRAIIADPNYWYLNYRNKNIAEIVKQIDDIKQQIIELGFSIKIDNSIFASMDKNINSILGDALMAGQKLVTNARENRLNMITPVLTRATAQHATLMLDFLRNYSKLVGTNIKLDVVFDMLALACFGYDKHLGKMYEVLDSLAKNTIKNPLSWPLPVEYYSKKDAVAQTVNSFVEALNGFYAAYVNYLNPAAGNAFENKTYNVEVVLIPRYIDKGLNQQEIENLYKTTYTVRDNTLKVSPDHKKAYAGLFAEAYQILDAIKEEKEATKQPATGGKVQTLATKTAGVAENRLAALSKNLDALEAEANRPNLTTAEKTALAKRLAEYKDESKKIDAELVDAAKREKYELSSKEKSLLGEINRKLYSDAMLKLGLTN